MTTKSRRRTHAGLVTAASTLLLLGSTLAGPSAHAATVFADQCVEFNTLTFDPPLTVNTQSGAATMTYTNTCAEETVSTSPPGESVVLGGSSTTYNYTYFGSCAVALLSGGQMHAVFGGTLFVLAETNTSTSPSAWVGRKAIALVPDKPCTDPAGEKTATGVGPAWGVNLS